MVAFISVAVYAIFIHEPLTQCQLIYKYNRSFIKMASLILSFHIFSLYYCIQNDSLINYQVILCLISTTCSIEALMISMGMMEMEKKNSIVYEIKVYQIYFGFP
uniref:Serpentine receptor class gamma n=1 Tax=Caenorhabditis tropicalis TaxID=1561998 RepID=A0A1I7USM8_9PELO